MAVKNVVKVERLKFFATLLLKTRVFWDMTLLLEIRVFMFLTLSRLTTNIVVVPHR
jgi:hypothetical protein